MHRESEMNRKRILIIYSPKKRVLSRPEQKDFKLVRFIFKLGRYFGTTPLALEDKSEKSVSSRMIGRILLSLYAIQMYFVVKRKLVENETLNVDMTGLSYLTTTAEFVFVVYSITSSTFRRNEFWVKLFEGILSFEKMVGNCDNFIAGKQYLLCIQLGLVHFLAILTYSLQFHSYFEEGGISNVLGISSTFVTEWYIVFFISYYLILTNWMKSRLNYLNENLVYISKNQEIDVTEMKKMVHLIKVAEEIVTQINEIFGSIMFYSICMTVLYFLYSFSYAIDDSFTNTDLKMMNFFVSISFLVSLVVLVMACESVEQSGERIIKTCYNLHESVENSSVRQQLELLVQYAEQWKPRFSAGGFYDINQSCLSSIFSAIITYLVIIIQFNMVLVDEKVEPPTEENMTVQTF